MTTGHEGARITDVASVVSVDPSQYYVGETLVASSIIAKFLDETRPHANVLMTRQQTITTGTLISRVEGAPAGGVGKHSGGAAGGPCKFLRHGGERGQVSVLINGQQVVAEGDWYDMDCGPNGGNVVGLVTYVVAVGPGAYANTETGERFQVGKEEPVVDDSAPSNLPGIGVVGPLVKGAAGVLDTTLLPMVEGALSLGGSALNASLYVAERQEMMNRAAFGRDPEAMAWVANDADMWVDFISGAGQAVWDTGESVAHAVAHPIDSLGAASDFGMSVVSGQVEAFYVDPATTTGHWMGNALNVYMLAKNSVAIFNAMKEARAARAAAALAKAEEVAALAKAESEAAAALAKAESEAAAAAKAAALAKAESEAAAALAKAESEAAAAAKAAALRERTQKLLDDSNRILASPMRKVKPGPSRGVTVTTTQTPATQTPAQIAKAANMSWYAIQDAVTLNRFERYAEAMKSGLWKWDQMSDQILLIEVPGPVIDGQPGPLVHYIGGGHTRVLAAWATGTPIPPEAIQIMPSKAWVHFYPWEEVVWR